MTFSSLFGERLKEARKALGWSQAEVAGIAGVSREYWGRCERGVSIPGSEVLAALAQHGVDVRYVLTGERDSRSPVVLSGDEQLLLEYYREAVPAVRKAAMAALQSGAAHSTGQSVVGDNAIQIGSVTGNTRIKSK